MIWRHYLNDLTKLNVLNLMKKSYDKYINYVVNQMVEMTDINSINKIHDQVIPPWIKDVNILPNLLEYDEWILDWVDDGLTNKPVFSFEKYKRIWNINLKYFYLCSGNFLHENYGVPKEMRRNISKRYRKRLREMIEYHRIIK